MANFNSNFNNNFGPGTYLFAPNLGELIDSAFGRLQIKRTARTTEMMVDGQREANFALVEAANKGPNLWAVDLQTVTLVQATATYSVPQETVMMLDVNIVINSSGQPISRTLQALSRTDYSQIPNPTQQGPPTSFWFNRTIAPSVTLWPTPDGNGPYTLSYYRFRQMQDANLAAAMSNVDLPYLFLDWFVAALSHRLSRYHAPQLEAIRKQDAMDAWEIAANQGTEYSPLQIAPMLGSYYS